MDDWQEPPVRKTVPTTGGGLPRDGADHDWRTPREARDLKTDRRINLAWNCGCVAFALALIILAFAWCKSANDRAMEQDRQDRDRLVIDSKEPQ